MPINYAQQLRKLYNQADDANHLQAKEWVNTYLPRIFKIGEKIALRIQTSIIIEVPGPLTQYIAMQLRQNGFTVNTIEYDDREADWTSPEGVGHSMKLELRF